MNTRRRGGGRHFILEGAGSALRLLGLDSEQKVNSQLVARMRPQKLNVPFWVVIAVDHFQGYPRNFPFYDRILLGATSQGGPKPPTDKDYSTPVSKAISPR